MSRLLKTPAQKWNERGQTLVLVPLILAVMLGICALVLDLGNVYVCYQELQASTQAAALAGAQSMSAGVVNISAIDVAKKYGGSPHTSPVGLYNIPGNMDITNVVPTLSCVNPALYPDLQLPACQTYFPGDGSKNVIQVRSTASVNTYFAKIFTKLPVPISAVATASARGGGAPPYNIMLVLDTTASMGSGTDTNCVTGVSGGSYTPEQCAQYGVQTLLKELTPCSTSYTTCPSGLTNAVDEVGLMVFPGLTATQTTNLTDTTVGATASSDYDCNTSSNPSITSYNNNPLYLILGFQNDYRTSAGSTSLNQGSNIFKSVGVGVGSGKTACGAQTPGGEGTFYAGVIVSAQDYLTANARTGAKNVIIFLSDGDATASATQMGGSTKQVGASSSLGGMKNGLFQPTAECTQAVNAANWAKGLGTTIYSISYGSANSGCNTGGETYTTPCSTMQAIGSTPSTQYFFSVPKSASGQNNVCPNSAGITQLSQVFTYIGGQLKTSRLVPNGVF